MLICYFNFRSKIKYLEALIPLWKYFLEFIINFQIFDLEAKIVLTCLLNESMRKLTITTLLSSFKRRHSRYTDIYLLSKRLHSCTQLFVYLCAKKSQENCQTLRIARSHKKNRVYFATHCLHASITSATPRTKNANAFACGQRGSDPLLRWVRLIDWIFIFSGKWLRLIKKNFSQIYLQTLSEENSW